MDLAVYFDATVNHIQVTISYQNIYLVPFELYTFVKVPLYRRI